MTALSASAPPPPATIEAALVDMYHRRAPAPIIALNILFAGLLVLLWWGILAPLPLTLWFTAVTTVAAVNILRHRGYETALRRGDMDPAYWRRAFTRGTLANGLAWGAGGVLLYVPTHPLHSSVILLLICGIAAGVAASQASIWRAVVWFAVTAILPPALAIMSFTTPIQLVTAVLLLFYLGYILTVGEINHRTMMDAIRLQFENAQLLQELREREQHFRSLVENAPDMLLAVGPDGKLLFHSPSMETLLGYSETELRDRTVFDLIHPDDQAEIRQKMQQLIQQGGTYGSAESRWRHSNGSWHLLQCVARRIGDSEPPSLVVNARDVTERSAMEDELRRARDMAEQANRVKSQFLATMSHEIRTPLHAILGMADLLQLSPLNTAQQSYVHTFQSAGRHLLNLIDDILDFSRIEADGLQLADIAFDLGHLLDEVTDLLAPQAESKALQLRVDVVSGLHRRRRGDAQRLRQIIVNLLGNAIKFTQHGRVVLTAAEDPIDAELLHFAVIDTGIGIAPEQQNLLFAPFRQLDAGQTRQPGGTGLGLSICQRLIGAMGGTISVDSTPGVGSRFAFTVRLPQDHQTTGQTEQALPDTNDLPPARLLVADDAAMNRLVLKEFLHDTPCHLTFVEDGADAVARYQQQPFDLILMDIQMPRMDGWEATRRIRAYEQAQGRAPIPIVAVSASAMEEDRQTSFAAGCTAFVAKPVSRSELLALLRRHLVARTESVQGA